MSQVATQGFIDDSSYVEGGKLGKIVKSLNEEFDFPRVSLKRDSFVMSLFLVQLHPISNPSEKCWKNFFTLADDENLILSHLGCTRKSFWVLELWLRLCTWREFTVSLHRWMKLDCTIRWLMRPFVWWGFLPYLLLRSAKSFFLFKTRIFL